jgi:hypothetical protein
VSTPASSVVVTLVWRGMCGWIGGIRIRLAVARAWATGGGVPVDSGAAAVEQERPGDPVGAGRVLIQGTSHWDALTPASRWSGSR